MILLAPALWIMKVETPHGTIVLKADPQAISGASVSIDDQQTITLGLPESSGPITLQVDPGSHKLRVSKPGFELFTHEFSLLTNDRHEIEVRLEPADSGVANDNNTSSPKPSIDERATDTGPGKPPAILGDSPLPGLVPAPSAIAGHRRWQIETLGLRGDIFAVAWGDQTHIACGSPTGFVRIIDATTSQAKHIFPAHLGSVWAIDWHQTTDQIVTAGEDGAVRLFDSSGRLLRELGTHTGIARCVAFNRDGSWIASGGFDSQVRLWRSTGEPGPVLSGHSAQIDGIAWHPSLKKLASASLDGTVRIWDLNQSWQTSGIVGQQLDGHLGGVLGLTWSFDGRLLASVGVDGSTILWNSDGTRHSVLDVHGSAVTAVACSPLGVVATSGDDKTVRLWRSDGTHLTTQNLDTTRINDLAWSHDGSRLAIATGDLGIRFLNASGQWDGAIELDSLAPRAIAFNPSGDLATVGDDGFIAIWNSAGAQKKRLEGQSGRVRSVAWSPDGNRLISASHEDAVRLWNASDGTSIARTGTAPAAWNPRNDEIAWVSGSEVHVEALGASDRVLRGHQSQVVQLAWNADGSQLASADVSGEIRVWGRDDTPQGLIKTDPSVAALVWHPIKPLLTTGSLVNGHVQVWSLDGNLVKSWNAHSKAVIALAWSSIGDRLLSSSFDQSVRVWSQDGDAVASLAGPMSICTGVAWRESDHQIATVHIDGTLCRWNSSTYEPTSKSLIFDDRDWVTFNSRGVANLSEPTAADNRLIVIAESESGALTTMKPSEFHNSHKSPSINGR
jgi:WD40 repeat protein